MNDDATSEDKAAVARQDGQAARPSPFRQAWHPKRSKESPEAAKGRADFASVPEIYRGWSDPF